MHACITSMKFLLFTDSIVNPKNFLWPKINFLKSKITKTLRLIYSVIATNWPKHTMFSPKNQHHIVFWHRKRFMPKDNNNYIFLILHVYMHVCMYACIHVYLIPHAFLFNLLKLISLPAHTSCLH